MPNIPSRPWLDESPVESVNTAAEQEAERRWPLGRFGPKKAVEQSCRQQGFIEGAEWAWENPPDLIRELLEAAREYRGNPSAQLEADELGLVGPATCAEDEIIGRLLAAAAALEEA